ncbi:MAG: hypothetical protein IH624_11230 [Phycisphaerae bacterium]|nr:hypothetical protein [Phycisphaerae bacterium]
MDVVLLRSFFGWCTVLNVGLLVFTALVLSLGRDWVYRMHSRFYPLPRDTFNVVIYSFIGVYKIVVIVFNLVPYIALSIIGQ